MLLKTVAQALPAFAMYVFRILKKIYKGITDATSHCWWGDDVNSKKMHWFACGNFACRRTEVVWDLEIVNISTKLCWQSKCGD